MARYRLILSAVLVFIATPAWSYTPPVGIPDPSLSWGGTQNPVDDSPPTRPDPWTEEVAGYYYVDDAAGCSDARTYGYPGTTRCTIPRPAPTGSYVELHGTYNQVSGGKVWFQGNGTSAAWSANSAGPVWIVGQTGSEPTVTGSALVYGAYVYLYNLKFSGNTSGAVLQVSSTSANYAANHIAIRNCDIQGTETSGVGVAPVANVDNAISYILIDNNTIRNHGPSYDIDQDSHMISVGSYVDNIWILNNALDNSSGGGMQFGASTPGPTFAYIGNNTVNNSRQSGIWVKYGTDIIVSSNTVHDVQDRCVGADTSPSKGLGGQYAPNNVWWINNSVYNVRYGIRVPSTNAGQGVYYALGNKIYNVKSMGGACFPAPSGTDTWADAAIHFQGGVTKYAVNNTIDNVVSGIHDSNTTVGAYFYNNIISNVTHDNGYALYTETTSKTTANYNLYYNAVAGNLIRWGASGTIYDNLVAFQAAVAQEAAGQEGNPVYSDQAANDYTLGGGSPAIDNGVVSSVYQMFFDLYGIDIQKDIAGTTRPQGSAWDIGAYEYASGDVTPSAFSYTNVTGAALSTVTTTNPCAAVAGIDNTTTITISGTGCTYNVDGGAYTADAGTVGLDNVVCMRGTSSGSYSTTYPSCTLTVGGVNNTGAPWTVRTMDAASNPVAPRMRAGNMTGGWR